MDTGTAGPTWSAGAHPRLADPGEARLAGESGTQPDDRSADAQSEGPAPDRRETLVVSSLELPFPLLFQFLHLELGIALHGQTPLWRGIEARDAARRSDQPLGQFGSDDPDGNLAHPTPIPVGWFRCVPLCGPVASARMRR